MTVLCAAGKGEMEIGACLSCALTSGQPPCGYDYVLLKSLLGDEEQEKRRGEVHVTDLTGCIRRAYYDKVEPSPEFVHDKLVRWLGTHVHAGAESEDGFFDSELPLAYDGIAGRADVVYKNGRLLDIKTTRWLKIHSVPYGSHALQVNVYAWMLRKMGRPVEKLQIQYIDLSGPSKCRGCKRTVQMIGGMLKCPECLRVLPDAHMGALLVDIPILTDEEVEAHILDRKKELEMSIALGSPPDKEPGFLCAYCAHYAKCQPDARDE